MKIAEYKGNAWKAKGVQAGFASTTILNDDKKVFVSGICSRTSGNNHGFVRLDFEQRVFGEKLGENFMPMKLYTKWSVAKQVTYMIYADMRASTEPKLARQKMLGNLMTKWEETYHQTLPPFDNLISKAFSQKYMKKTFSAPPINKCNLEGQGVGGNTLNSMTKTRGKGSVYN